MTEESLHGWKLHAMRRAQAHGDVVDGLVLTGQVAASLTEIVSVAEFVPGIVGEADRVLTRLARTFPQSAT
jgi:enoyl-[acyl-carrier protein] reductase II